MLKKHILMYCIQAQGGSEVAFLMDYTFLQQVIYVECVELVTQFFFLILIFFIL